MRFTIDHDHPCLPGHFPGRPVVPGVVVLERVFEAVAVAAGGEPDALRLPQAKFVRPLLPGEAAEITLDGARPRWRFRVTCGADTVATGEVVLPA